MGEQRGHLGFILAMANHHAFICRDMHRVQKHKARAKGRAESSPGGWLLTISPLFPSRPYWLQNVSYYRAGGNGKASSGHLRTQSGLQNSLAWCTQSSKAGNDNLMCKTWKIFA